MPAVPRTRWIAIPSVSTSLFVAGMPKFLACVHTAPDDVADHQVAFSDLHLDLVTSRSPEAEFLSRLLHSLAVQALESSRPSACSRGGPGAVRCDRDGGDESLILSDAVYASSACSVMSRSRLVASIVSP